MSARPNNAVFSPAHPRIADALCVVAESFADAVEPTYESLTDWRQDAFWVGVIAFVFWVVVPNLPAIAGVLS